jgi:peroxiredoxin
VTVGPGLPVPPLLLHSTEGPVDLAALAAGRLVLFVYPSTGRAAPGWDAIPGARGCTAQACAFRDRRAELEALGAEVAGLSVQPLAEQRDFAARHEIPYRLISDPELQTGAALSLPTFAAAGRTFYRRLTLVAEGGRIAKVFYPVEEPERNAADVLAWLADA